MEVFGYLVALVGCLVLPGWVFLRAPDREANQGFALLGLSGLIYNGCSLAAAYSTLPASRLAWTRHAYLGAFLLLPLVVRFPRVFLEDAPSSRRAEFLAWTGAAVFAFANWRGTFLTHLDTQGQATGGITLGLWTVVIGAAFVHFTWSLHQAYLARPTPALRNRLLYLVLGAVLFALPAASDLLFRLGIRFGQPFPLAPLGSVAFLVCLAVAVVKHRLLDIEVVLHRGLVVSLLAPTLAASFVVIGELVEGLFAGTLPPESPYPNILAALCVAALFGPLTQGISDLVESLVIPEFKVAPQLRDFRRLPQLIGAEDIVGLRILQRDLDQIIGAIEAKRRVADVPDAVPPEVEAGPARPPRRRRPRGRRTRGRKRRRRG
jgi:hypothetical protein